MAEDASGAAIEAVGLVKQFAGVPAVDGLDLQVGRGTVHGFLGPNGAGKSTTIRVLLGLYRRDAGQVRVLGVDPADDVPGVTRRVSYVPGDVALWPNLTGREVLDALGRIRGGTDPEAERRLVDDYSLDVRRKVRTYSKGNRQKVMLVAAFAAPTELLILDEPTSGLDPLMEEVFQAHVRAARDAGRTVLLSSHVLAEVDQVCEAVTIIKDGRLVETGQVADLRHLAASTVTALASAGGAPALAAAFAQLGLDDVVGRSGEVRIQVAGARVNEVLGVLVTAGATAVSCVPATLEELFLRHYRTDQGDDGPAAS